MQNRVAKTKRKRFDKERIKLSLKQSALYILSKEKYTDITKAVKIFSATRNIYALIVNLMNFQRIDIIHITKKDSLLI